MRRTCFFTMEKFITHWKFLCCQLECKDITATCVCMCMPQHMPSLVRRHEKCLMFKFNALRF